MNSASRPVRLAAPSDARRERALADRDSLESARSLGPEVVEAGWREAVGVYRAWQREVRGTPSARWPLTREWRTACFVAAALEAEADGLPRAAAQLRTRAVDALAPRPGAPPRPGLAQIRPTHYRRALAQIRPTLDAGGGR